MKKKQFKYNPPQNSRTFMSVKQVVNQQQNIFNSKIEINNDFPHIYHQTKPKNFTLKLCSKMLLIINVMKTSKLLNKNFKQIHKKSCRTEITAYTIIGSLKKKQKKKSESQTHFANIYQIISCLYISCPHSRIVQMYSSSQKKISNKKKEKKISKIVK